MNSLLAITYAFALSLVPEESYSKRVFTNVSHVNYEIGLDIADSVHLFTGEDTWQEPHGTIFSWQPYVQRYYLGAEYHKTFNEAFNLSIGAKHECNHSVSCFGKTLVKYDRSYTEMYARVEGRFVVK